MPLNEPYKSIFPKYKYFLDMDGVLTDFVLAVENLPSFKKLNLTFDELKKDDVKFWEAIRLAGISFWRDMPWMSEGRDLFAHILTLDKNPTILTAIPEPQFGHDYAAQGKREWCKRELGNYKVITCLREEKQDYVSKNSVLIDDKDTNIDEWNQAGGIGILHTDLSSTLKQLQSL